MCFLKNMLTVSWISIGRYEDAADSAISALQVVYDWNCSAIVIFADTTIWFQNFIANRSLSAAAKHKTKFIKHLNSAKHTRFPQLTINVVLIVVCVRSRSHVYEIGMDFAVSLWRRFVSSEEIWEIYRGIAELFHSESHITEADNRKVCQWIKGIESGSCISWYHALFFRNGNDEIKAI